MDDDADDAADDDDAAVDGGLDGVPMGDGVM